MGYEHWEDTLGGGCSRQCQIHTHSHSVPHDTQGGWSFGQGLDAILTHESVARPLTKLMVYEHREDAARGGGSRQCQTHTHTHTHSVSRDTQGAWNLGQGSNTILTHVGLATH